MGQNRNRRTACGILAVCLAATVLPADDNADVSKLIKDTAESLTRILREEGLTRADRLERVIRTVKPVFDYKSMAMLTLGRTNWKRLNEDERAEFYDLFIKQLEHAYFDKAEYLAENDLRIDDPFPSRPRCTSRHALTRTASRLP